MKHKLLLLMAFVLGAGSFFALESTVDPLAPAKIPVPELAKVPVKAKPLSDVVFKGKSQKKGRLQSITRPRNIASVKENGYAFRAPPPRASAEKLVRWAKAFEEREESTVGREIQGFVPPRERLGELFPLRLADLDARCPVLERLAVGVLIHVDEKGSPQNIDWVDERAERMPKSFYSCRFSHPDRRFEPFRLIFVPSRARRA